MLVLTSLLLYFYLIWTLLIASWKLEEANAWSFLAPGSVIRINIFPKYTEILYTLAQTLLKISSKSVAQGHVQAAWNNALQICWNMRAFFLLTSALSAFSILFNVEKSLLILSCFQHHKYRLFCVTSTKIRIQNSSSRPQDLLVLPLYSSPSPRKPWQPLIFSLSLFCLSKNVTWCKSWNAD